MSGASEVLVLPLIAIDRRLRGDTPLGMGDYPALRRIGKWRVTTAGLRH
jgi:hypothetical protein